MQKDKIDSNKIMCLDKDTGIAKRIIAGAVPLDAYLEHISRYVFSAPLIKGKSVLDVACGTGYGSFYLAQNGAKEVIGMDISLEAIKYAKMRYKANNLHFCVGNAIEMPLFPFRFDSIVSFETIEHLLHPKKFLEEINKIVKKNSLIIISTPNKNVHLKKAIKVPFHTHEFSKSEFLFLIQETFALLNCYGQRPAEQERNCDRSPKKSRISFFYPFFPSRVRKVARALIDARKLRISLTLSVPYYLNLGLIEKKIQRMLLPARYRVIPLEKVHSMENYTILIALARSD